MSYFSINRVVLVGRLTRDPELRALPQGPACAAYASPATRAARDADGEFAERPNYFDVSVFGAPGESVSRYMRRGSASASTAGLSGASGRPPSRSAGRPSASSPTPSSSSTAPASAPARRCRGAHEGMQASPGGDDDGGEFVGVGAGVEEDELVF